MSTATGLDPLTLACVPRPRTDISSVEVDGETVLYSPNAGLHRLDHIGTAVWRCFDGVATLREVADDLEAVVDGEDPARLRQDLLQFVRTLSREGLLEVARA